MADVFAQAEAARERGLMLARAKACHLYTLALDRGDLDTIVLILRQAEEDSELDRMIRELNQTLHEKLQEERPEDDCNA